MNEDTIVLTKYQDAVLFMSMDKKRPLEYQLFFENDDETVGNIYVCMIRDIVKNIEASFVDYGNGRIGFLKSTAYKRGALVALQLKKQGTDDKAPVFTDKLSISGMYTVLTLADKEFKISKKIKDDERRVLKDRYDSFFSDLEYGITLRTNARSANISDVLREADDLAGKLDIIIATTDKRTCGTELYKKESEWIGYCFKADVTSLRKIITDRMDLYGILKTNVIDKIRTLNKDVALDFYEDKLLALNKLYSIETGLKKASDKKVWLKSGGHLFIERTKSLTSIDVNTGKTISGNDRETTFLKCNLEAAEEICYQMRLRNLSGIIIIDFINMEKEENQKKVIDLLKSLIRMDSVQVTFHDVTPLSLVELTRQKVREPLDEQMKVYYDKINREADHG